MENNKKEKIILETILERDKRQKKRRYVSQCAVRTKNGSWMQTENNKQESTFTLQHGWPLMYITSNSNRTPPLTCYSIGRLQNANRKIEEKQRE